MSDLYTRLGAAGLGARFVRERILPDWWDDKLADVPANRQLAEIAISRMLGIPPAVLRDHTVQMQLRPARQVRLKHVRTRDRADLNPSILIAERFASAVVREVSDLPMFAGPLAASEVRRQILAAHRVVTLAALVEFAWDHGVVVAHLSALPPGRKLHGVAMFEGHVPVTILAHGTDAPPRIAFDLAHELGHVFLGHVTEATAPLADEDLAAPDADPIEQQANAFAHEVLTGQPGMHLAARPGFTASRLALWSRTEGSRRQIEPGTLALAYGFSAGRMPVAQAALKELGLSTGAKSVVSHALARHLPSNLPETAARWLDIATPA